MEELIAKRYAQALSSIDNKISGRLRVLNLLSIEVSKSEFKSALRSPLISSEDKTEMILSFMGVNVDRTLINFIKVLGENKRLDLIPEITKVLNKSQQQITNKYEGIVKSSSALNKMSLTKLENRLKEYTGSTITLRQEKTDLDGMRVLVDDLGIEVNFSKQRVKEDLIDFITKSL